MVKRRTELLIGTATIVLGTAIVMALYAAGAPGGDGGYPVHARFNRSDGITVGSDVRLSGLSVGEVVGHELDKHYRAVVRMRLDPNIELTSDTAAIIQTDGLLGAKYIALQPGGDDAMIVPGGEIIYTQDAVVLEDLLETIIAEAKLRRGQEQEQP